MDLNKLNTQQRAAVTAPKGIVRVIAGAGSGKTSCINAKIIYEVNRGMDPKRILALTFTKKAGQELRHRLKPTLGDRADLIFTGTFHSFAHQLLCKKLNYTIITDADVQDILATALEDNPQVSMKTNDLMSLIGFHRNLMKPFSPDIQPVATAFKEFKLKNNLKDYDDLLEDFLTLLKNDFFKLEYDLIVVDEAQDNSKLQNEITKQLLKRNNNLFVVGDFAQSIYAWRGADPQSFLEWKSLGCTDFPLSINYRSTPEVLKVANRVLKEMESDATVELVSPKTGECPKAKVIKVGNSEDETNYVVNKIQELRAQGYALNKIAILYRSHYVSNNLQLKLSNFRIPFTIWSGQSTVKAQYIQDVICFLRAYSNPKDVVAWGRIFQLLPRVGKVGGTKMAESVTGGHINSVHLPDSANPIKYIFSNRNPISFIEAVKNFYLPIVRAKHPDTTKDLSVTKFLDYAKDQDDLGKFVSDLMFSEAAENETNGVTMTTIHSAKGLEWDTVFVIGIYDGVFPSFKNPELGEELRLFYVAVTRAKTFLYCLFPEVAGEYKKPTKSMFLNVMLGKPMR
jgi:DNA helicase-2/ATP-dependent DNA helicase PcrA